MSQDYLQRLRYKLQKAFRRLNVSDVNGFHYILVQFWELLQSHSVFSGIMDYLDSCLTQDLENEAERASKNLYGNSGVFYGDSDDEHVIFAYLVLKRCVSSESSEREWMIGTNYTTQRKGNSKQDYLNSFIFYFVEPLYEYIDESLDNSRAILALLVRYKRRSEWFHRDSLLNLYKSETSRGEKNLALDLYEYLFDQGLDFSIEPWSVSGAVDLISMQDDNDPLIADAKVFDQRGKSYIEKGFKQVYQYTLDYNQPFGYLVIYKVREEDLSFSFAQSNRSVPFVTHNGKTIFFLTVDIFDYEGKTASKRGKLKSIEITESGLIQCLESEDEQE